MALQQYVGAIILEVDGQEVECTAFSPTITTGRIPVRTMNRNGKIAGYASGVMEYELKVEVPVVSGSQMRWDGVTGAKLVIYPAKDATNAAGQGRIAYTGCVVTSVGEAYKVEGEARRTISLFATDMIEE